MKETLLYSLGAENVGTSEETLYSASFDSNFTGVDPPPSVRTLTAWGFLPSPGGDVRIRVYSDSNLRFDTGGDLNDLVGQWILKIDDFESGPSLLSFTLGVLYHKTVAVAASVPYPGSDDFSITAECENVPGINISAVRYFVSPKESHQV